MKKLYRGSQTDNVFESDSSKLRERRKKKFLFLEKSNADLRPASNDNIE